MTALDPADLTALFADVEAATAAHAARYPGGAAGRQPVHTVYVPADRFSATTVADYGAEARWLLDAHAPDAATLAAVFDLDNSLAARVLGAVGVKLERDPVEDLRVDFEDGYGHRDDAAEDDDALAAADAAADAAEVGSLPPFVGLRVKPFCDGLHRRSVRTLDVFCSRLVERLTALPDGFVVTFPKVVAADHVAAFAQVCGRLEVALGLADGALRFEVQVETTQSVLEPGGRAALPGFVAAAGGRMTAAHFGTFDYTAACGLGPAQQRITHPACDFARHVMQVSLAGTGVRLSDGSTNVVPASQRTADVHAAWRRHAADVRHSLHHGFVQGWDLHPAQLPSRFATVFAWLLADLDEVVERVRAWSGGAAPGGVLDDDDAAAAGGVLDEPATVTALLGQLRRAVACGAADAGDLAARAGVDPATLHP